MSWRRISPGSSAAPGATYPGWVRRCNLGTGDFNNDLTTSDTPGDVWSCSFTGTSVSVIAPKEAGSGRIEVQIDGQTRATADLSTKRGRPVFNQALKLLRGGKAQGIILHKLDRGARNLRDWAAIGELSDQGIEVHFVTESIDLQTRGGRLSADIQAVVAADYIRNLREETRKGFYGRLKQGLYPLQAPLGYLDQGGGKPKTIDPVMGPLIRRAFELYGTAQYNLETLGKELYRLGLRSKSGREVKISGLSTVLNNTFYIGLIRIQKTNETFVGIHDPIIGKTLFDRVQTVLTGKTNTRSHKHDYPYRRTLFCTTCHYSLIAERQKGKVYYRCHTKNCPQPCVREETIKTEVSRFFQKVRYDDREREYYRSRISTLKATWASRQEEQTKNLNLKQSQIKDRLNRLTDAYLDQALDKMMFEERKKSLLLEQKTVEENLANVTRNNGSSPEKLEIFLELAGNAWLSHQMAEPEDAREMLNIFTSNRQVEGQKIDLKPSISFQEIVNRPQIQSCAPERDIPRTWDRILDTLTALNSQGLLPDLSAVAGLRKQDDGLPDKR
jgi:DNA invertase Pin-like site-specific DNA recombinase